MTYTQIVSYTTLLAMTVSMIGLSTAQASEVLGTLSSDAATTQAANDGTLNGTVIGSDSNSSRGGGGGSTRTTGSLSDTPSGSVLGAAANNTPTPGFPNAGSDPANLSLGATLWSHVTSFIKQILTF